MHGLAHDARGDGPQESHARHDGGAPPPAAAAHQFADQRDARPQLPGQPEAGHEAEECVLRHGLHERVAEVGDGIEQDGAEEHGEPAAAVPQDAPRDAAQHHADQLGVEDHEPRTRHVPGLLAGEDPQQGLELLQERGPAPRLRGRQPKSIRSPQTPHPDHGVDHQVVEVHEVAERGHDDRQHDAAISACSRRARRFGPPGTTRTRRPPTCVTAAHHAGNVPVGGRPLSSRRGPALRDFTPAPLRDKNEAAPAKTGAASESQGTVGCTWPCVAARRSATPGDPSRRPACTRHASTVRMDGQAGYAGEGVFTFSGSGSLQNSV